MHAAFETNYFKWHDSYFWQWEGNAEVVAISGGNTIAYRELIIDVYERLSQQGVPPFGAFLLTVAATNPNAKQSLERIRELVGERESVGERNTFENAMKFLNLLGQLPQQYREKENRIRLFLTLFDKCHNRISERNSAALYEILRTNIEKGSNAHGADADPRLFNRDFRTIEVLHGKFKTVEEILTAIASLPDQKPEINLQESQSAVIEEPAAPKDFVDELIQNDQAFYVGALIRQIWAGLNIPVHSKMPSQQPVGGISDLTNKGDFDRLLISEFANDDMVLLSRLANNEALYLNREIPPKNNDLKRIILVDATLRNWGTPKRIAFAAALAIAKHPKTDIDCEIYVMGDAVYPFDYSNIDSIIEGTHILEGGLSAANGLRAFFDEYGQAKNRELFVITEKSTLKQADMLKCLDEFQQQISYLIHPDADGNIEVFKRQQKSKRQIQQIKLDLEELWKNPPRKKADFLPDETFTSLPLLVRNPMRSKKTMVTRDGLIFQVTSDRTLLRLYDNGERYNKGWDQVCQDLPSGNCDYEIGEFEDGSVILLAYQYNIKTIMLIDVFDNSRKTIPFPHWTSGWPGGFFFHDNHFIHSTSNKGWKISQNGEIAHIEIMDFEDFSDITVARTEAGKEYYGMRPLFKNINEIFINPEDNLVFNIHKLHLNNGLHFKMDVLHDPRKKEPKIRAERLKLDHFEFEDGSTIRLLSDGVISLKSSNPEIPVIYIPSVLDTALGMATDEVFAGNEFFFRDELYRVKLRSVGPASVGQAKIHFVQYIASKYRMSLEKAQNLDKLLPLDLPGLVSQRTFLDMKNQIPGMGGVIEDAPHTRWFSRLSKQEKISTTTFYKSYLEPFVRHILTHAAST